MNENEEQLKNFLDLYSLKNLVQKPTCYKSQTARCIDLVLTIQNASNFEHVQSQHDEKYILRALLTLKNSRAIRKKP